MMQDMARKQVLVQLDDAQVKALDGLASAGDDNRSELIRRAIDLYVEAIGESLADVRYAQAYARVPEDLEELTELRALSALSWSEA